MIKSISLSNVASYSEKTELKTDKRINLIYGLNGSGKTTLSNFLKNPKNEKFSECFADPEPNAKVLVYNREFIDENFYESDTQPGIFTLGQGNKEAKNKIEELNEKIVQLQEKLQTQRQSFKDIEEEIKKSNESFQQKIWKIKTEDTKEDRVFEKAGFFDGLKNNKGKLAEHIKTIPLKEEVKDISDIKKQVKELNSDDSQKRDDLKLIEVNKFDSIEKNELFSKQIVGQKDSSVSKLITELQNSNWVKEGVDSYVDLEKRKSCPFCQEETLTEGLINNIKGYFDKSYQKDIEGLNLLKKQYEKQNEVLKSEKYEKSFLSNEQKLSLKEKLNELDRMLTGNASMIDKKISNPSKSIELSSTLTLIKEANELINNINDNIDSYNKKIENKSEEINKLKDSFWNSLRKKYDGDIKKYDEEQKDLKLKKSKEVEQRSDIETKIKKNEESIKQYQKTTTSIDEAIEFINKHFVYFGIKDFEIVKHSDKKYKVKRNRERDTEFKSFSEGEKTVISFLYFLELCKGKETKDDASTNKIIVIDDPVSSLSHIFVYNISNLIKTVFFENKNNKFSQIFILTHSLYFFNELLNKREIPEDMKLFRIFKNPNTVVQEMKKNEIQNEYQAYWSIIKDEQKSNMPLMANAMRNIIEYFFGFIEKSDSLNNIFQKKEFKDNRYQSFRRYMDRGSHSDPLNISDYKEFDYNIFKEVFREVFKHTGYEEHYNKMIDKKCPDSEISPNKDFQTQNHGEKESFQSRKQPPKESSPITEASKDRNLSKQNPSNAETSQGRKPFKQNSPNVEVSKTTEDQFSFFK